MLENRPSLGSIVRTAALIVPLTAAVACGSAVGAGAPQAEIVPQFTPTPPCVHPPFNGEGVLPMAERANGGILSQDQNVLVDHNLDGTPEWQGNFEKILIDKPQSQLPNPQGGNPGTRVCVENKY